MDSNQYLAEAAALVQTHASLAQLIEFTRKHDPTSELQAEWGEDFEAKRDQLVSQCRNLASPTWTFGGSHREALLCMAHCVVTAPYLGVPEDRVRAHLNRLLLELASDR